MPWRLLGAQKWGTQDRKKTCGGPDRAGRAGRAPPPPGRYAPEEDTHRVGAPRQTQLWGRPGPLPPRPLSTALGQAARVLLCPFCWAGRRDRAVGSPTAAAGDVSRQPFLPTAGLLHNRPKNNLQGGQCREMSHLPPGTPQTGGRGRGQWQEACFHPGLGGSLEAGGAPGVTPAPIPGRQGCTQRPDSRPQPLVPGG